MANKENGNVKKKIFSPQISETPFFTEYKN